MESLHSVIQNFNTQILFVGHLIKIKLIWITVLAHQVRPRSWVSSIISIPNHYFIALGLGSYVLCKTNLQDLQPKFHPQDGSWVSDIGCRFLPKILGLESHFFGIPKIIAYITCWIYFMPLVSFYIPCKTSKKQETSVRNGLRRDYDKFYRFFYIFWNLKTYLSLNLFCSNFITTKVL